MPQCVHDLIVFPTELALRRFQQQEALKNDFVDASGHTTFSRLRKICLPYAAIKGTPLDAVQQLLLRRQVVDVAAGHFSGQGALGELSANALSEVLEKLITELASLPADVPEIINWLLEQRKGSKRYQLGMLASVWRATLQQEGFADAISVNLAVLKLLRGNRSKWPPILRDCRKLTFSSVRWFNPFEEQCVSVLNQKLKISVESALPHAHAEAAADRLGQKIHAEIMAEPWAMWTEDLGDALAVNSPEILSLTDTARISFSRSAGRYGEAEDLARRISWNLQVLEIPANRIALVVPNIGQVQDIIPNVFRRFNIPYFFRRGRPVLSSAVVKSFMAWLAFPLRPERDAMLDLVRNPALKFGDREGEVERLLQQPPRLKAVPGRLSGFQAQERLAEKVIEPEDHFNREALARLKEVLEHIGSQELPLAELVDVLENLLENETVKPRDSHERGVWIINPHDAAGLDFDVVLFAGLNEGEFPAVPQQDALLNDQERFRLRTHLEEQGHSLPKMALPKADVLFEQQSVLFLTTLGMAREQLVFSYQAVDQEGNEKSEGEYFRKLWNLAGWPAQAEIQLSPYDLWRAERLDEDNFVSNHWKSQQSAAPEDRLPMPGESFLPIIPLPLCRAEDEALQSAVHLGQQDVGKTINVPPASCRLEHLVKVLQIESEREAYLETPIAEREPSTYCGHIDVLKNRVNQWLEEKQELSPTALEALAHNRYVFLLERVFGIYDPRVADDTPDPMERGGLIHSILCEIYSAIAEGKSGIETPALFAVKSSRGWKLRKEGGVDALPLAVFDPNLGADYEAFARRIANRMMDQEELGHPGVWAAERRKMLAMVLNFVRYDVETCAAENRYPVLFEQQFGKSTAVDLGCTKVNGVIDRIDLVFEETGELRKVRVLDYKGSSKARPKKDVYVEEIIRNLDCQLPVYAFAAQQHFFGEINTAETNARTEAGYLIYERDFTKLGKQLQKSLIPMDEADMLSGFFQTLERNIAKLKAGDFAVDPLIAAYTDHTSVCRTEAVDWSDIENV
ncbi:PD-(D/E)XK nuclease family protein [Pontiella agarivorans]|uniref:PD-(D/E)XK nuclease family protein n=1 Tax=Pontiella agarivorans TaxID=3038953 RepID=A0ABU5MYI7_9BACT|nr:PD-(D/E)XK nuclease family protein [Pontiella agarivorans]MDZ8119237.1 PD-(D/E)XK nuclease family protein [Pontiella agarivorans]